MQQSFMEVARQIIETAWRQRYLLCLPVLCMIPLSLMLVAFAPKSYVAKSLMLLQEQASTNPLGKEFSQNTKMQDRIAGLQALMKSDRVLGNVYRDLYGETAPGSANQLAGWIRVFGADLSLELIGNDFIEFRMKGGQPKGMGKQLEAVTARFIEALLPEQNALYATQVLLDKRKDDLDAAERALAQFRQRNAALLAEGSAQNAARVGEARARLEHALAVQDEIKSEVAQLQGRIANGTPGTGRIEQQIAQVSAEIRSLEGRGNEAGSELQTVQGRLADLLKLRTLETRRDAFDAEIKDLRQSAEQLQRQARQSVPIAQQLTQLERDVIEARDSFDVYSKRYAKPGAGRTSGILNAPERIKLIDVPRDPDFATSAGGRLATMAIGAGFALGIGLALLAELFDPSVRRPEDLAAASGLPIVARLA